MEGRFEGWYSCSFMVPTVLSHQRNRCESAGERCLRWACGLHDRGAVSSPLSTALWIEGSSASCSQDFLHRFVFAIFFTLYIFHANMIANSGVCSLQGPHRSSLFLFKCHSYQFASFLVLLLWTDVYGYYLKSTRSGRLQSSGAGVTPTYLYFV